MKCNVTVTDGTQITESTIDVSTTDNTGGSGTYTATAGGVNSVAESNKNYLKAQEEEQQEIALIKAFAEGATTGETKRNYVGTTLVKGGLIEGGFLSIEGSRLYFKSASSGWKGLMARRLYKVALVRGRNAKSYGTLPEFTEKANLVAQELEGAGYHVVRVTEEDEDFKSKLSGILMLITEKYKDLKDLTRRTIEEKAIEAQLGGFISLGKTEEEIAALHRSILALTEYQRQIRIDAELTILRDIQDSAQTLKNMVYGDDRPEQFTGSLAALFEERDLQAIIGRLKAAKEYMEQVGGYLDVLQQINRKP